MSRRVGKARTGRESVLPAPVLEILRFCFVVFFSGVGYELTSSLPGSVDLRVGTFQGAGLGILIGAGVGYVIGGVLARLTGRTLVEAEKALVQRSPEQVLAGLAGAGAGVAVGAALSWPALLLGRAAITIPIFVFVCVVLGMLGYRIGMSRRDGMLSLISRRVNLQPPAPAISAMPKIVDTSVIIDGRIIDVVRSGFLHGVLLVPEPVMRELQGLADAGDELRRAKGRRGLDVLESLRRERAVDLEVVSDEAIEIPEVDAKLVRMALDRGVALLTLDTNLARSASLAGCRVMNLHALALALRPPVTAGDSIRVLLTKPGKEAGQAVGYLDDGTMVVVERARSQVGREVQCVVTSVLVTANGRLVFTRLEGSGGPVDEHGTAAVVTTLSTTPRDGASGHARDGASGHASAQPKPHPARGPVPAPPPRR